MTSTLHTDCLHPATSSARARCRRDRAKYARDHYFEIEFQRLERLAEERREFNFMTTAQHALCGGAENADDSLVDLNIIQYSEEWYSLVISGFWSMMNNTRGGDLRWTMNIDYATPEEIENGSYEWLDD